MFRNAKQVRMVERFRFVGDGFPFGDRRSYHHLHNNQYIRSLMDNIAVDVEVPAVEGGGGVRRKGRSTAVRSQVPEQRPFVQQRLRYAPTEVISADEVESIHDASLRILEDIGMDFLCPESRSILAAAGADVRPGVERVRFDRNLILDNIAKAPEEFTLHARNPDHNLQIGRNWVSFG